MAVHVRRSVCFLFSFFALQEAGAQTPITITDEALGYEVPQPIDSLTPVEGFRTYDALRTRYLSLSLDHEHITAHGVGTSIHGRTITGYRFGRESDRPKGAAVFQGGLHAREWAAVETTAAIFEWLALESESDAIADYVLDRLDIVISPLANPDGIVHTQEYWNQTYGFSESGSSGRDGRMRRKNLRDADEDLYTAADRLNGIDLNRNHPYGYGSGSSAVPSDITYRGSHHGSEPETQAFYSALGLIDTERLRLGIDFHSYQQAYYVITDNEALRNTATRRVYTLMRSAALAETGRSYGEILTPMSQAVGATDEFVTGEYGAMGFTCEARPTFSTNAFILPASQVADTKKELLSATRSALYYAAGPAALVEVRILEGTHVIFQQRRVYTNGTRTIEVPISGTLMSGRRYTAHLVFDKPMRDGSGGLPGIDVSAFPAVALEGEAFVAGVEWRTERYTADTAVMELEIVQSAEGTYALSVSGEDAAATAIDGNPLTVADWSRAGWINAESGTDSLTLLTVVTPNHSDMWQMR